MQPMTEYQHVTADMSVYRDGTIKLHGPDGFDGMRKAGLLAAQILDHLGDQGAERSPHGAELQAPGVEPGHVQQGGGAANVAPDHPFKPGQPRLHAACRQGANLQLAAHELHLAHDGRHGVAELVRGMGQEVVSRAELGGKGRVLGL